jgi:hypothetical protein
VLVNVRLPLGFPVSREDPERPTFGASHKRVQIADRERQSGPRDKVAHNRGGLQGCLGDASVDLVTVAQAVHWFDLPRFYAELLRVARPECMIAVWCYQLHTVTDPLDLIRGGLATAWGDPDKTREVTWPLHLRVGRVFPATANK